MYRQHVGHGLAKIDDRLAGELLHVGDRPNLDRAEQVDEPMEDEEKANDPLDESPRLAVACR